MLKKVRRAIITLVVVNTLILMGLSAWGGYYYSIQNEVQSFNQCPTDIQSPDVPKEVFLIGGIVKEINENSITADTIVFSKENLVAENPETFKVIILVNEKTEIIKIIAKSDERTIASLNEIVVGDLIFVESDKDIKNKVEFTANRVEIIKRD